MERYERLSESTAAVGVTVLTETGIADADRCRTAREQRRGEDRAPARHPRSPVPLSGLIPVKRAHSIDRHAAEIKTSISSKYPSYIYVLQYSSSST